MQTLQYLMGFGAKPKKPEAPHAIVARHQQTAAEKPLRERLQEQMLAQQLNVEVEQEQRKEAHEEARKAFAIGDQMQWKYWTQTEREHQKQELMWQAKRKNTEQELRLHENAQSNLQHGMLMQEVNSDVKQTVDAIQTLKLDDAIDTMKELASDVAYHDKKFSEPLLPQTAEQMEFADNLDDEWQRMNAQKVAFQLPTASTGAGTGGATVPAVVGPTPVKFANE